MSLRWNTTSPNMALANAIKSAIFAIGLSMISAPSAFASFLDEDFWCRTYGCVVVADSRTYDIYDNFNFDTGRCCIAFGSPMQSYFRGTGPITTNYTNTLNAVTDPGGDHGMMFGITDGAGNVINAVIDDGDGFLDASDSLSAFGLDALTDISLAADTQTYSHSFYISSRNTRFSLRGQASLANSTGDLRNSITLADIGFQPSITRTGNDNGFNFGRQTNRGQIQPNAGIATLDDISGVATEIVSFNRNNGIARIGGNGNNGNAFGVGNGNGNGNGPGNGNGNSGRGADLEEQLIRLDFLYTIPQYDLSMGIGDLNLEVVFDFYREQ